jgi:hypothetical protein
LVGIDAEHPDLRLVRGELRVVVLDPPVELQGGAPEDPAVLDRREHDGDVRASSDVGDQFEVPLPRLAVRELAIGERRDAIDPDAEMEALLTEGIAAVTWQDKAYPARLKEINDPPPVLYVRGNLAASDELAVAVVGTRRPTPYGRQVAEEMAQQLATNRLTIVSGLARGVDAIAHRAALQTGGRTIAVMACGLDMVYPPEHARLAREISERTVANMKQNLAFALVYNALGVPVAAGVLYPAFGLLLSPVIAAVAMSFSSVSVVTNALRLRRP